MTWLGPLLQLDKKIMELSIMQHVTTPPASQIDRPSLGAVAVVAVLLLLACGLAWRSRDLVSS